MLVGHEVLAPVLDPLHRAAEQLAGDHDRELLRAGVHLQAEGAADVGHDDVHLAVLDAEARAIWSRTPCGPCVEIHTVS